MANNFTNVHTTPDNFLSNNPRFCVRGPAPSGYEPEYATLAMERFDLIIVGAGAAGLKCAVEANKRGRRVLLLDQAEKVGQKIRISGGGRANFTNVHTTPDNFLSNNPRFCVSALKRYAPDDFIAFVNKHGIAWHERNHGQLSCDGPAQQITDMLLREAEGVTVQTSTHVSNIDRSEDGFRLQTGRGECVGDALVIAT